MGGFTYENQGTNTYLVYTMNEDDRLDSMSLGMITNNDIHGLAPAVFMQMNTTRYIKYNVSSKIPVSQFFSGTVSRKRLLGVFSGIVEAILSAEEYMINVSTMLVDPAYIYTDVSTCETVMICLPIQENSEKNMELGTFFKKVMFDTQFDQSENCDYVTKLINHLNRITLFSLSDFRELLNELKNQQDEDVDISFLNIPTKSSQQLQFIQSSEEQQILPIKPDAGETEDGEYNLTPDCRDNSSMNTEIHEKPMSLLYLLRHYDKQNVNIYKEQRNGNKTSKIAEKKDKKEKKRFKDKRENLDIKKTEAQPGFAIPGQSVPADFGDTVFAGEEEEDYATVIWGIGTASQPVKPHLFRKKNNEIIPINKELFRLGRNPEFNDYVIAGNDFIGNSHCHIIIKNEEYFIVDDNSKNHTFVEGAMIPPGKEVKLSHGQNIALANEEFEFHLF